MTSEFTCDCEILPVLLAEHCEQVDENPYLKVYTFRIGVLFHHFYHT